MNENKDSKETSLLELIKNKSPEMISKIIKNGEILTEKT